MQNENAALKERLSHFSSSRTSSISPPLAAATLTTAPMVASVDEMNSANYHQSPSAPTSPRYMRSNTTFTQQSASVPSSPHQHLKDEGVMHTSVPNNLPPPLSLPPPQQQAQQQAHQQQLQSVFSSMSVSSNPSSAASTPTLSSSTNYPYSSYPSSVYIPQPPQLFNNSSNHVVAYNNNSNNINQHQHIQQHQQHQQQQQHHMDPTLKPHPQQNLRPLLPATKSPHPPAIQNHQTAFLPALRMSGYEKIYGNVCRY